ncbi:MAG: DNA/RNA nuclease SfsA [Rhodospirillaceae bacterium]|nr:DNA/RNA nuclease SfsA [Rhodospirillaceae bacterium]MBT4701870.1 DNA/RNA nuclease SfsA [Rhodospirillaceae bacterium]MBT5036577.1 DNA/RNA nuclease SfsA [Rhodospirillaceae bacterium]MBT8004016.1 DNA/RNA nuclease SfsA [Rhodospirillales bacterium]
MKFPDPLIRGTLIKRYKRFLTDVELENGEMVTAHCANPGSMLSLIEEGAEVWLSPARNPKRKLKYTWELIRIGGGLVGLNTALANAIVEEAITGSVISELSGYTTLRREVKYGQNSRIDILLEEDARPTSYVEIKSVTMKRDLSPSASAEFPDSVTTRGSKHLGELADMVSEGHRAVMMYLVQREDSTRMTIAEDIDPAYAENLKAAMANGVEAIAYTCKMSPEEILVTSPVELVL